MYGATLRNVAIQLTALNTETCGEAPYLIQLAFIKAPTRYRREYPRVLRERPIVPQQFVPGVAHVGAFPFKETR